MRSLRSFSHGIFVAGVAAVVLSGCTAPGAKKTSDDFDAWLVKNPYPGLTVADVSMQEVLPAVGSAEITVALSSDASTSSDDVVSAMDHVCGFQPSGFNSAQFNLTADRVTMLVECTETDPLGEQWQTMRVLPGLKAASLGGGSVDASFSTTPNAKDGLQSLRKAGLPVRRYTVYVMDKAGDVPWSVREDVTVTDETRAAVDRVLESHQLVWMVSTYPETPSQPERIAIVASGSERIARMLRKELYAEHPDWKPWVQVVRRAT